MQPQWQDLPGEKGVSILSFTGKPDVTSSSSYLIDLGDCLLLIDPGADTWRAAFIAGILFGKRGAVPPPLLVILTHCHVDHCYNLLTDTPLRDYPLAIAAHEVAADALVRGDAAMTAGDIFSRIITPREIRLHLFSPGAKRERGVEKFSIPGNLWIGIGPARILPQGKSLLTQDLTFPGGHIVTVYATPGHTSDSICLKIGEALFLGDILFATAPGIAGVAGFSKEDLIHSADALASLIPEAGIRICFNGHGDPVSPENATAGLRLVVKEARLLPDMNRFDPARLGASKVHALDLLDEAGRVYAILGGRLLSVSHNLASLGEEEEAARFVSLIDIDAIDRILEDFFQFSREFQEGKRVDLAMIQKANQILRKIERVVVQDTLSGAVDHTILRRTGRLLDDFLCTIRGLPPSDPPEPVETGSFLRELIRELSTNPFSDEEILMHADDEAAFRRDLVARVAYQPLLPGVTFSLQTGPGTIPPALLRTMRLHDALIGLCEDCAAAGCDHFQFRADAEPGRVVVVVYADAPRIGMYFDERRLNRHTRAFSLAGAEVTPVNCTDSLTITLALPFADPGLHH